VSAGDQERWLKSCGLDCYCVPWFPGGCHLDSAYAGAFDRLLHQPRGLGLFDKFGDVGKPSSLTFWNRCAASGMTATHMRRVLKFRAAHAASRDYGQEIMTSSRVR
jgi:hypothetical protein